MKRFAVCVAVALMSLAVYAQQASRDAVAQAAGTASLSGTIVEDSATGLPLRRVIVALNGVDANVARTAITDELGHFTFTSLPAGRFSLVASKWAYVTTYYRNRRPGRSPAVPLPLMAGQQLTNVTMKMMRGAVLTGRLRDQNGGPAPMTIVQALMVQTINGARTVNQPFTGSSFSDERGLFRIFGLVPGEYVLSASVAQAGTGSAGGLSLITPDDIARAEVAVRDASALTPTTSSSAPSAAQTPTAPLGYAPVYAPGTTDFTAADVITLGPAEERTADVLLRMVPMARISGVVSGVAGGGVSAFVTLVSQGPSGASSTGLSVGNTGAFSFSGIAPGSYALLARATAAQGVLPLTATADIVVEGRDLAGISLALQPGVGVSGHVIVDPHAIGTLDLTTVKVGLQTTFTGAGATFAVQPVTADASGAFSLSGVTPGKYRVTAAMGAGEKKWMVRSATIDDRDVSEQALEIQAGGPVTNLIVAVTDHVAEVSGQLQDGQGSPTSDYALVLFSVDKRYWVSNSTRIKGPIRPGADGHYTIGNVPPGEYFLAAANDVDQSELADVSLLEQLAAAAVRLTVAEGEKKTQDIRIGG